MDKYAAAEALLARISTRERAREVVGDLLEVTPHSQFWWPLLCIVMRIVWLRTAGFLLAATSLLWLTIAFAHITLIPVMLPFVQAHARQSPAVMGFHQYPFALQQACIGMALSVCAWPTAILLATIIRPRQRLQLVPAWTVAVGSTWLSWSASLPLLGSALCIVLAVAAIGFAC